MFKKVTEARLLHEDLCFVLFLVGGCLAEGGYRTGLLVLSGIQALYIVYLAQKFLRQEAE